MLKILSIFTVIQMKKYITIACLTLIALVAYGSWAPQPLKIETPAAEMNHRPVTQVMEEPSAEPTKSDKPESKPQSLPESNCPLEEDPEPLDPAEEEEQRQIYLEIVLDQYNVFLDLVEKLESKSIDDPEREALEERISMNGGNLADLMINAEPAIPEITLRGWTFFANHDGTFDYTKNPV